MFHGQSVQRDDTTAASREDRMFRLLKNAMEPKVRFAGQHQSSSRFESDDSREPNLIHTGLLLCGCWSSLLVRPAKTTREGSLGSVVDVQPARFCALWRAELRNAAAAWQTHPRRGGCSSHSDSSSHSSTPHMLHKTSPVPKSGSLRNGSLDRGLVL